MEGVTPPYGHQGLTCVNSKQRTLTTISHNSKPELNRSYPAPAWDGGNVYLCFPNIEYPICYGVLVVFMDVWRLWQDIITTTGHLDGQDRNIEWTVPRLTVYTGAHIDSGFLTVTVAPADLPSCSQLFLISSFPWPGHDTVYTLWQYNCSETHQPYNRPGPRDEAEYLWWGHSWGSPHTSWWSY